MCEFCLAPNSKQDRDANHVDFAGFFSPSAIEAAVRQANNNAIRQAQPNETSSSDDEDGDDDDTDGT